MKMLRVGLVILVLCAVFGAAPVHAATNTAPSVEKVKSPVLITGFSLTGPRLEYVQLRNTGTMPLSMNGMVVSYVIKGQAEPLIVANLEGYIAPGKFLVVGEKAAVSGAEFSYELSAFPEDALEAAKITITSPAYEDVTAVPAYDSPTAKDPICPNKAASNFWTRHVSDSTGNYTSSYDCFVPSDSFVLENDPRYEFAQAVPLQVTEVLANPRSCSPLDADGACREYVKVYNPTNQPVSLANVRLRTGYQGQSATTSNTYRLDDMLVKPGRYATITQSADGRPLSLTNSGGYVWLEDTYGIKRYDNTVQRYADASLESKKGLAWAYDERDGTWKWTARPMPGDQPSVFVAPPEKMRRAAAKRSLVPCKPGQYRNPATNRCRSLASVAAASLAPCKPGQARNPETNRCRKIGTAASALKPCKPNQERNPATNRCRNKTSSIPGAAFAVEPVAQTGKAFAGWWALGGVGVLAVGYAAWEWRSEALGVIRKTGAFLIGRK